MAKTKGVKSCTPGNVKCGNRCIPQSWDCRLRGEGQDKALKASQAFDPLGTLAQVQRGSTRILKGVQKANFSEIEGGRRQLIRTVSRNSSGKEGQALTLKEKKEIQDRLIAGTAALGTAAAVLAGGYAAHRTLMRAPSYRQRVGNGINNAVNDAQNRLLDAVPLTGGNRVKNATSAAAAGERGLRITAPNASANRALVLGSTAQPPGGPSSELVKSLKRLKFDATTPAARVEAESLRTYLGAKKRGVNIHAESAAMETLAGAYGLELRKSGSMVDVKTELKAGVEKAIAAEKAALRSDMQQRGFAVTSPEAQGLYIEAVFGGDAVREARVTDLLTKTPKSVSDKTLEDLTKDWSDFYNSMADSIGDDISRLGSGRAVMADTNDVIQVARVKHAEFLDRNLPKNTAGGRINRLGGASTQNATMQLTAVEYHTRKNAERAEWTAPKALVGRAAREQGIPTDNFSDTYMEMSKKFVGLRGEVQFPVGVTRQAKDVVTNGFGFNDQEAILNIYKRLRGERKTKVSSVELMRQAVAQHKRDKRRRDSEDRNDFTSPGDRAGKPCGKSFVPKSQKCTKPTTARYAEKPKPEPKKESKTGSQVATILGTTVGATAAVAALGTKGGRRLIRETSETVAKGATKYSRNPEATARLARKTAAKGVYNVRQEALKGFIDGMSNKQVRDGINTLPKEYAEQVNKLVGDAKAGAAAMSLELAGYKPRKVDTEANFSSFINSKGDVKSIGSVGDNLITFTYHDVRGEGGLMDVLPKDRQSKHVIFQVDRQFDAKADVSKSDQMGIFRQVQSMFKDATASSPDGTLLLNTAYDKDGKGAGREAIYRRAGFNQVEGIDNVQWAVVEGGKVKKVKKEESMAEFMAILQGTGRIDELRLDVLETIRPTTFMFWSRAER